MAASFENNSYTERHTAAIALVLRKLLESFVLHRKHIEACTPKWPPSDSSHAYCKGSIKKVHTCYDSLSLDIVC